MATNAERQRNYRLRHLKDAEGNGQRLNVIVEAPVKRALERLSTCYDVTQRTMLERLLLGAERDLLDEGQSSQVEALRSNAPSISGDVAHRESLRLLEELLAYLESWPPHPTRTEWMAKIADHLDDPEARLIAGLNVERAGGRFLPTGLGVTCLANRSSVRVRVNEDDWDRKIGGSGSRTLGEYIKDSLTSESGLSLAFQSVRAEKPAL
ncbi:MAG: hypothetical protein IV107_03075 [Paucibacter sp.]|nr:hypothetical protein [Roseateles sp.]